jgi:hypothetical protein
VAGLVSWFTLWPKREAIHSSETLGRLWTTQRYNPEHLYVHSHHHVNFRSMRRRVIYQRSVQTYTVKPWSIIPSCSAFLDLLFNFCGPWTNSILYSPPTSIVFPYPSFFFRMPDENDDSMFHCKIISMYVANDTTLYLCNTLLQHKISESFESTYSDITLCYHRYGLSATTAYMWYRLFIARKPLL